MPHTSPRGRAVVLAFTIVALLLLPMTTDASAGTPAPRQEAAARLARSVRLINYYPSQHSWQRMWTEWSPNTFDEDMAKVAATSAGTVRLIVFPYVFGYPTPNAPMAGRLAAAVAIAGKHGLTVQLTLFDYWGDYHDFTGSRQWTSALVSKYRYDRRIALVEVRNEIDPADPQAMAWAKDQIGLLHSLLPDTPVTISTNGQLGVPGLVALKKALNPVTPDLFDLHYYGEPGLAYGAFRQAVAGAAPTPVFVGEAGASTDPTSTTHTGQDGKEAEQANWYRIVEVAAKAAGLAPVAPWTLYDFAVSGAPAGLSIQEYSFGLYHLDGTPKKAAGVVGSAFSGTLVAQPYNGRFSELVDGGARAASWNPWMPSGVVQIGTGTGVDGDNALVLSQTKAQNSGVTSWYTIPMEAVRSGQTWRVSVQARGTDASGLNDVTLAWFDGSGRWLGNTSSNSLTPGTTKWATLIAIGLPPSGAEAVQVHLRSSGNGGSVFFSRATWTVTSG